MAGAELLMHSPAGISRLLLLLLLLFAFGGEEQALVVDKFVLAFVTVAHSLCEKGEEEAPPGDAEDEQEEVDSLELASCTLIRSALISFLPFLPMLPVLLLLLLLLVPLLLLVLLLLLLLASAEVAASTWSKGLRDLLIVTGEDLPQAETPFIELDKEARLAIPVVTGVDGGGDPESLVKLFLSSQEEVMEAADDRPFFFFSFFTTGVSHGEWCLG